MNLDESELDTEGLKVSSRMERPPRREVVTPKIACQKFEHKRDSIESFDSTSSPEQRRRESMTMMMQRRGDDAFNVKEVAGRYNTVCCCIKWLLVTCWTTCCSLKPHRIAVCRSWRPDDGAPLRCSLYNCVHEYFGKENHQKPIRPEMTDEIKWVFPCPFSHEILRDPVPLLVNSGQTFER